MNLSILTSAPSYRSSGQVFNELDPSRRFVRSSSFQAGKDMKTESQNLLRVVLCEFEWRSEEIAQGKR